MTGYDRDSTLSLDNAPEHLPESDRGAQQETDVSASMLQQMSRASDLQEGLMELYRQGGRGYGQAMFALQRVLGNVGVERLHQQSPSSPRPRSIGRRLRLSAASSKPTRRGRTSR